MNVISVKTFGMTREGSKIMSVISDAGHQVVKNLSEPSEIILVHLDIYADYLREKDSKLGTRAVRALLTTVGPRLMRADGHYIEVYGPYPILMNVDGSWTDLGFSRSDLIPTNIRLAAANQGAISLDELSGCRKLRQIRPVHPRRRPHAQLRRYNRPKRRVDTIQGPREEVGKEIC